MSLMINALIARLMNEPSTIDRHPIVKVSDTELTWDCPDGMCGHVTLTTRKYVYKISKGNIKYATVYKDGSIWLRADVFSYNTDNCIDPTGNDMECIIRFEEL